MAEIKLKVSSNSKNIPAEQQDILFETSMNGIEVMPKDLESFPMPWDAEVIIADGKFKLVGGVGPSGFGRAIAELPLNRVSSYLDISIYIDNDEDEERVTELFTEYGWL